MEGRRQPQAGCIRKSPHYPLAGTCGWMSGVFAQCSEETSIQLTSGRQSCPISDVLCHKKYLIKLYKLHLNQQHHDLEMLFCSLFNVQVLRCTIIGQYQVPIQMHDRSFLSHHFILSFDIFNPRELIKGPIETLQGFG